MKEGRKWWRQEGSVEMTPGRNCGNDARKRGRRLLCAQSSDILRWNHRHDRKALERQRTADCLSDGCVMWAAGRAGGSGVQNPKFGVRQVTVWAGQREALYGLPCSSLSVWTWHMAVSIAGRSGVSMAERI
ncbi:hypothetical protein O3P69_003678 [Scylla paramamosain]|uniref:Uncharacterized protein n=1 Tax=Scylla paramamosain TaxID=85552 RepID=A0AAW0UK23_SCYPA